MELHHTAVKEEKGFSAVELLLCLIIVGLIAFIGYFVYQAKSNTNATLHQSNIEAASVQPKTSQLGLGETDLTKLYLFEDKGQFSIRIPDGWKLHGYNSGFVTFSASDLKLRPGTTGVISFEPMDLSKAGLATLSLEYQNPSQLAMPDNGQVPGFITNDNVKIVKYRTVQEIDPASPQELPKGSGQYDYYATYKDSRVVHVYYGVKPGEADHHSTVEAMLRTLHFE